MSTRSAPTSSTAPQRKPARPRIMAPRRIADILDRIAQYQQRHGGQFPTARSAADSDAGRNADSWSAIDNALRRNAIAPCPQYLRIKAALAQRGLTPSLARLNPAYAAPRVQPRRYTDILAMVRQSVAQHGRFPIRTSRFDVAGFNDSWTAIDSALIDGAIAPCPLWQAHCQRMAELGVTPSLASLNPAYLPVRRQPRSLAAVLAAITDYMGAHGGKTPTQRSPFPAGRGHDSWKAVCKALSTGAIVADAARDEFHARLALSGQKPTLFTLIDCYRTELKTACALAFPDLAAALQPQRASRPPVSFAALVAQLFPPTHPAGQRIDPASLGHRLSRTLKCAKW